MQNRRFSKIMLVFAAAFGATGLIARQTLEEAKLRVREGYKAPSYSTNFPSETLLSIADIKKKTYKITSSKALRITRSATYDPTNEVTGSPMFKVQSSTVIIDLNGQVITKNVASPTEIRAVAIEVGYSPEEINNLSGVDLNSQPQNVIIRNGTIDNFDMGIVVHKGVKSVRFEDLTFSRTPIGVAMLGGDGADEEIVSSSFHNIKVIGGKINDSDAIVWAKNKVEDATWTALTHDHSETQNYGYTGATEKLVQLTDSTSGATATAAYYGVVMRHVNNILLQNVAVDGMGFDQADTDTITVGIDISDSNNVFLEGVTSSHNLSSHMVKGLHVKDSTSFSGMACTFNNNSAKWVSIDAAGTIGRMAHGIHFENVNASTLNGVACNKNEANATGDLDASKAQSYGFEWATGNAIELKSIECSHNEGNAGICYGMKVDTSESLMMDDMVFDYNHGTGGGVTDFGATGLYLSTYAKSALMSNISVNANYGSSVAGLRVANGESITLRNFTSDYSNGTSDVIGLSFETAVKSLSCENVSVVSNTSTGAAGSYVKAVSCAAAQSVSFDGVRCNYNTSTGGNLPVTAMEFTGSAKTVTVKGVTASNNAAHGTGAITGLVIAEGESITLDDVQFNSNTGGGASQIVNFTGSASTVAMKDIVVNSNSLTAGNFDGILMDDAVDVRMRNVSVNNNTTATNDMSGIYFKHTDNSIVNSVEMSGVTVDGNSTDVGEVYGLRVDDARNVTMTDCSLSDNSQTGAPSSKLVTGIKFGTTAESVTMKNVVVNNNIAKNDSTMTAIEFGSASALIMENVVVNNNSVVDEVALAGGSVGSVYGILFTGAAKSCGFDGLTVNYNNATNTDVTDGIVGTADGMKFAAAAENISIANSSISHTISSATTDSAVHGLWFATSVKSLDVSNSIFNSNEGDAVHGMLVTSAENVTFKNVSADQNNGTGAVLGMEFATSVQAVDMKNVTANNNSSSGSTVHGMKLTDAVAVSLDGGSVNNNNTDSGAATGIQFAVGTPGTDTTDSVTLRNLSVDNTLTSAASAAAIGISINGAENLILDNVTANHTKSTNATAGNVQGITLLASAHSVEMDNVVMNGNTGANVWGLLVDDGKNFTMNNIAADQNSGTGTAFGIDFTITDNLNTNAVDMHNVSCNANSAAAGIVGGLRINAGVAVTINDISADYNQATGGEAVGIEVRSSASALVLNGASASNNVSTDASATGVRVVVGNAVSMDDVSANYNNAADGQQSRGIHFKTSLASAHLSNLVCDSNFGGDQGVGIHVEAPSSVSMNNVSASKNDGDDRAYGCYLAGSGENVLIRGALFNGNAASDANTAMAAIDETGTVSKHLPVNHHDSVTGFATLEGGFGLYVNSIDSCQFENVEASRNQGMRAGGIYVNNCNDAALRKCKTSFQHADGNFFFDVATPFAGVTSNVAVDIPDAQAATFFGDTTTTYTVDMVQTVTDYLAALRNIKYLQDTDDYDPSLPSVYTHLKNFAGSQLLLRAVIAQFRRFSTAVGVQLHNCINGVVEDHIAVGNRSDKDSSVGIGVSGTAEGHVIVRCKAAGNEAWSDSAKAANGNMDISEILPFWTFLNTVQLTAAGDGVDFSGSADGSHVDPLVGTITSAMIAYDVNDAHQPDMLVAVDADRLAIALNVADETTFTGSLEEYGPAVGGEAVGILVGDAASSIEVSACDCANNKGNSGKAFGLMQDVTTSLLAKDNRLYQTLANDLGYCFGLAEFTLQSNSIHLGNVMFSNAIGDHLNANFFVPFDPEDHPNIFFPVKIGYNGDIGNFANASPFDNLVVNFVAEKQVDPYLGAGIAGANNLWESSAWVENPTP